MFAAGQRLTAKALNDLATTGTWTPELTATTTNPTLGTGAVQDGLWHRNGQLVVARALVQFGTSGADAGSGEYRISLPFDVDTSVHTVGAVILDAIPGNGALRGAGSSATWRTGLNITLADASTVRMLIDETGLVSSGTPWVWTNELAIMIDVSYLADPNDLP